MYRPLQINTLGKGMKPCYTFYWLNNNKDWDSFATNLVEEILNPVPVNNRADLVM